MRRGEIWLVDFEPVVGNEANKRRPAVVVSNDGANATAERLRRGTITVVPVTSNISTVFAFQVLLTSEETGLSVDGKAQAEQIRSVSVTRLVRRLGSIPYDTTIALDEAIRLHLAL